MPGPHGYSWHKNWKNEFFCIRLLFCLLLSSTACSSGDPRTLCPVARLVIDVNVLMDRCTMTQVHHAVSRTLFFFFPFSLLVQFARVSNRKLALQVRAVSPVRGTYNIVAPEPRVSNLKEPLNQQKNCYSCYDEISWCKKNGDWPVSPLFPVDNSPSFSCT